MTWELRNIGWPIPYRSYTSTPVNKLVDHGWPIPYRDDLYKPYVNYNYFHSEVYKGQKINYWV